MKSQANDTLHSYRCFCGKLLFKGFLLDSTVQIKCRNCGELMSFQGLQGKLPEGVKFGMMFDRFGNVVSASSNIQKLFGYKLSELLSKNYGELLQAGSHATSRVGFGRLWSLPYKERYFYRSNVTFKDKNGVDLPGVIQSKFVSKNDNTLLFSIFNSDDTSENIDETEFSLLREYPFVLRVDRDGTCIDTNSVRRRPHSRPQSEVAGRSFVSFMREDEPTQRNVLKKLQLNKHFQLIGKNFERADGEVVCMDVFFTPNFDASGTFVDYSCFTVSHETLVYYEQQLALRPSV
jgi:PAS domain S-box-containing protein